MSFIIDVITPRNRVGRDKQMPQFLTDFFVITEGGKVVFNKCNSPNIDEQLVGGFFFACNVFLDSIFVRDLKSVEFKKNIILFYKSNQFLFVGFAAKTVNEQSAQNNLESLGDKFVENYHDLPKEWSSNLQLFRDFDQEVEKTKKDRALDFIMERFHE